MKLHPWRAASALLTAVLLVPCAVALPASPSHSEDSTAWKARAAGSSARPAELRLRALDQKSRLRAARVAQGKAAVVRPSRTVHGKLATIAGDWTALGPAPVISDPGVYGQDYGAVTGRITALAVDPNDASGNTVYAGAAYGGLWKSTNATASAGSVAWTPLLDSQPTLAVGAVAVQPGHAGVILVGTGEADGSADSYFGLGLLRSTDGGATWTQITSADSGSNSFVGLGFSRIAFSAGNPNLVVAAVSGNTNGSRFNAVSTQAVAGLYYSTDGGASWHLGTSVTPAASATDVVFSAAANGGAGAFYAALQDQGVYSSTDGVTWTALAAQPPVIVASAVQPYHTGRLAVVSGRTELYAWWVDANGLDRVLARSNDGGATWVSLDITGIESCGDGSGCGTAGSALSLAAVPLGATGTDVYAGATNLYKCSTADATDPASTCQATSGETSTAGFVNLTHVYGCGGPLATTAHLHGGQHSLATQLTAGGDAILYVGNDGGAYRALSGQSLLSGGVSSSACSGTNPFDNLTGTMGSLSGVIGFAQHPTDATAYLAGLQDNGVAGVAQAYNSAPRYGSGPLPLTTWTALAGVSGSHGFSEIDATTPDNWYTGKPGGEVDLCTSGASTALGCIEGGFSPVGSGYPHAAANPWSGDPSAMFAPFITDPQLTSNLLVGTCRVWRGNGVSGAFSAISPELDFLKGTNCLGSSQKNVVSAVAAGGAVTANGSQVIYAGTAGTGTTTSPATGRVFVTTSADSGLTAWREITGPTNPRGFTVSSILVDQTSDPTGHTAYLALQGYLGQQGGRVWKTTNAGGIWTDISKSLPDVPVSSLMLDPVDHITLYAGTDVGVFVTQDGGATWAEYGAGLPNAPVTQMRAFNSGGVSELRVGTYGRGLWSIPLLGVESTLPNFSFSGISSGVTVLLGGSVTTSFTLNSTNGFADAVTLSCPSAPAGVTCSFDVNPVTLASGGSATVQLTISAEASALAQLVNLAVQGTSGSLTQTTTIPVTVTGVQPTFVFRITSPDVTSVVPGGTLQYGISIDPVSGFNEPVTFSCIAGIPQGGNCTFDPATITGSGTGTLTIQTAAPAAKVSKGKTVASARPWGAAQWLPLAGLALAGLVAGAARRRRALRVIGVAVALASVAMWLACGSSSSTTTTTSTVAVTISPTTATLFSGAQQQFTASVTGSTNTTVTWTASPGTIDTNGLYTAPFYTDTTKSEAATVTATSQADATQSAKATVTINAYSGGTPPGVYTVTVQATSTHQTQTGTVSITVQ